MKAEDIVRAVMFACSILFAGSMVALLFTASNGCTPGKYAKGANHKCPYYGRMDRWAELWGMTPKYKVKPTITTPSGIRIDPTNNKVAPAAIEDMIDRVDLCMYEQFGQDGKIVFPDDVYKAARCYTWTPKYPIDKSCITIKVDEERYSCSGNQTLKWIAPESGCLDKGKIPTKECPCRWRSGMQDGHTIVTTPDFFNFADWYVRVFYGCVNPWGHPDIAKCIDQGRL